MTPTTALDAAYVAARATRDSFARCIARDVCAGLEPSEYLTEGFKQAERDIDTLLYS